MPVHDWSSVPAGIFHHFHHNWITAISNAINSRLPKDFYALAEQTAGNYGPDVLTLGTGAANWGSSGGTAVLTQPRPKTSYKVQSDQEFYRVKKKNIAIKHVSGDRVVAVVELVSPGNKSGKGPFEEFLSKASDLLSSRIHLLIVDVFPPTPRDPFGVHAAIWDRVTGDPFDPPEGKPLTAVGYECTDIMTIAHVEPFQ